MKKLIISILYFIIWNTANSQELAKYYNELLSNKNDMSYYSDIKSVENINIFIKNRNDFSTGLVSYNNIENEYSELFVFGSIDSLWFVVQGLSWDQQSVEILDSLHKFVRVYCYDYKFKPVYKFISIYSTLDVLYYLVYEDDKYWAYSSNWLSRFHPRLRINDISIIQLVEFANDKNFKQDAFRVESNWSTVYINKISKLLELYSNCLNNKSQHK